MTDLEITERVAKWLWGEDYDVREGNVWCRSKCENKHYPSYTKKFYPLHDWNDLMTKVVDRLIIYYDITYYYDRGVERFCIDTDWDGTIKSGKFPDEFPRAVCELIVNLYEKEERSKKYAPWTEEEIAKLDERQADMSKHQYTCQCGESLTAYRDGWHCDYCHSYHQNWCHSEDVEEK